MDARGLAEKLRMGSCPIIPSREAMGIGDEIMALLGAVEDAEIELLDLRAKLLGWEIGEAQLEKSRARAILIAFGALDINDCETDPLDLLVVLLPPHSGG